jgi:hypothetical protein
MAGLLKKLLSPGKFCPHRKTGWPLGNPVLPLRKISGFAHGAGTNIVRIAADLVLSARHNRRQSVHTHTWRLITGQLFDIARRRSAVNSKRLHTSSAHSASLEALYEPHFGAVWKLYIDSIFFFLVIGLLSSLFTVRCWDNWWMMNWKGFRRKWSWTNKGINYAFDLETDINCNKLLSIQLEPRPRFEPSISFI